MISYGWSTRRPRKLSWCPGIRRGASAMRPRGRLIPRPASTGGACHVVHPPHRGGRYRRRGYCRRGRGRARALPAGLLAAGPRPGRSSSRCTPCGPSRRPCRPTGTSTRTASWWSGAARRRLHAGSILVSNFNNKANQQGTGTTIVEISPGGQPYAVRQHLSGALPGSCPGGVGLTTALAVLPGGWVVVGSTPSANGMAATARAGCLIVLDRQGRVRETIAGHGINGPWDATAVSHGSTARPVRHQRAQRHGGRAAARSCTAAPSCGCALALHGAARRRG